MTSVTRAACTSGVGFCHPGCLSNCSLVLPSLLNRLSKAFIVEFLPTTPPDKLCNKSPAAAQIEMEAHRALWRQELEIVHQEIAAAKQEGQSSESVQQLFDRAEYFVDRLRKFEQPAVPDHKGILCFAELMCTDTQLVLVLVLCIILGKHEYLLYADHIAVQPSLEMQSFWQALSAAECQQVGNARCLRLTSFGFPGEKGAVKNTLVVRTCYDHLAAIAKKHFAADGTVFILSGNPGTYMHYDVWKHQLHINTMRGCQIIRHHAIAYGAKTTCCTTVHHCNKLHSTI